MRSKLLTRLRTIRGVADARMQQSFRNPQLRVDVDRSRMAQLGLTERDVTNSVVTSIAGSSQTAPTFWLNPQDRRVLSRSWRRRRNTASTAWPRCRTCR